LQRLVEPNNLGLSLALRGCADPFRRGNRNRSRALTEREAFLCLRRACAKLGLAGTANQSAHEATEDVFGAGAEGDYRLNIGRRARAQGAGDLDCGAGLTALAERDSVRTTLVGARLASRAFSAVERCRRGGFPRLSPQLCVGDASFGNEFDEREAQLVREQLVMRE
jgi:hypothetical protein